MKMIIIVISILFVCKFSVAKEDKYEGSLVYVEGGKFTMGGRINIGGYDIIFKEHDVELSNYYIGKYEVTNYEFCNYLNQLNKSISEIDLRFKSRDCFIKYKDGKYFVVKGYENFPVTHVSWKAAQEFCQFYGGRLPTEAEWEYAALGGRFSKDYIFSGSNNIDEVGIVSENIGCIQPVGTLKPNELGIYDMSGNVTEFCFDWYDANYYNYSPILNPQGPERPIVRENNVKTKVMRGSSFDYPSDVAMPFYRLEGLVGKGGMRSIGFRICYSDQKN